MMSSAILLLLVVLSRPSLKVSIRYPKLGLVILACRTLKVQVKAVADYIDTLGEGEDSEVL